MRGQQQHGANLVAVIAVPLDHLGVRAKRLAEQVARDPIGILPQDLMVDVFDELELD